MKKYLLVLVLLLLAAPVQAKDNNIYEYCEVYGNLAYAIMGARQAGVAMSRQMDNAGDDYLFQQMVLNAYNTPRQAQEDMKQVTAEEFRDIWYLSCITVLTKKE